MERIVHPTVTSPKVAKFFPSNRGIHPKLQDPFHYVYRYNKQIGPKTHYSCFEKERGCTAKAHVQDGMILSTSAHSHSCDILGITVDKIRAQIKDKVKQEPSIQTAKLVTDWSSLGAEPALITATPLIGSMSNRINLWKRLELKKPAVPLDLDDQVLDTVNIPLAFKCTRDGGPFLR